MGMVPVLVMCWPATKLRKVALGWAVPAGQIRVKPSVAGVTAVTDASTARPPTGIPQPPTLPPWAGEPGAPVTVHDRAAPAASAPTGHGCPPPDTA